MPLQATGTSRMTAKMQRRIERRREYLASISSTEQEQRVVGLRLSAALRTRRRLAEARLAEPMPWIHPPAYWIGSTLG